MSTQNPTAPQILFVDDEATAVKYFQRAMEAVAPVAVAGSVEEGRRLLDRHSQTLSVVVSDQRMPGAYGNELLNYARLNYPRMVRILTTAYSELELTIEAVNAGQIHRYISKPWETSALRMEMKQALGLAALQKEHAQLLCEKILVHQQQLISSRIGALHALCSSFVGPEQFQPLETYLSAALAAGVKSSEPDWLAMDYADMVSAEARRTGQFGYEVGNRLAAIRQRYRDWQPADGLVPLMGVLEGQAQLVGDGAALFAGAKDFAEFLKAKVGAPILEQHASWLALLVWLSEKGCSLQATAVENGIQCRLATISNPFSSARLAEWVRQFCEG